MLKHAAQQSIGGSREKGGIEEYLKLLELRLYGTLYEG